MFTQIYIAHLQNGCESCEIVNPPGRIRELGEKAKRDADSSNPKKNCKKCFKKNQEGHSAPP
jgi:hypothetical protein